VSSIPQGEGRSLGLPPSHAETLEADKCTETFGAEEMTLKEACYPAKGKTTTSHRFQICFWAIV